MHNQRFKIFKLELFYLPIPNVDEKAMILEHKNTIAIKKYKELILH